MPHGDRARGNVEAEAGGGAEDADDGAVMPSPS